MRVSNLLIVLAFLAQLDLPPKHNDFVSCLQTRLQIVVYHTYIWFPTISWIANRTGHTLTTQVEICSGCGNLSKGLRMAGFAGKEFDVPWYAYFRS